MAAISLENCNEIIPNLFVGGINAALQTHILVEQGIRAVVCCVRELEFPTCDFADSIEYYRVDVEDIGCEPIELFWPEATEFIDSFVSKGQAVLVHCRAGVSRSATTAIAYMIQYQGYTLHDAFILARKHRPVVTPNIGFMQKLCDFEAEERRTSPTIAMLKYSSWFCGSQVAAIPDVGVEEVKAEVEMVLVEEDSVNEIPVSSDQPTEETVVEVEVIHASGDFKRVPSPPSPTLLKLQKGVRKVMTIMSLTSTEHKDGIDKDLPDTTSLDPVAGGRVDRIRVLLLRRAARDPDLGYCQGMHFAAALFVAIARTQAEAYWRFDAFINSVRGLWLPGFPLLAAGASQFQELAHHRPWFTHLCEHKVTSSMYLSTAWLSMFAAWLPLSTLTETLQILEGRGFAGMLAMTLAILDHVSLHLLDGRSSEEILEFLHELSDFAPNAITLAEATRNWLPKVVAHLAGNYALGFSESRREVVVSHVRREVSRILVRGEPLQLPSIMTWVRIKSVMLVPLASQDMLAPPAGDDEISREYSEYLPSNSGILPSSGCWSWCNCFWFSSAGSTSFPPSPRRKNMTRTSVKLTDQKEERSRWRSYSGSMKASGLQTVWIEREREHARKTRNFMSWAASEE